MNKNVPFLVVMLFTPFAVGAQSGKVNNFKKISFIAEGGGNLTTINGESQLIFFHASKLKPGFGAGLSAQLKIVRNVFVQAGVSFVTKGAGKGNNVNPDLFGRNLNVNSFNIDYVEAPVNFIYNPSFAKGRIFFGAGVFYAYGLSARLRFAGGAVNVQFLDHQNVKGLFGGPLTLGPLSIKPTDYGINILGGYNITYKFFAKLTGQWGLHNISTVYTSDTYLGSKVYHTSGAALSLGYRL